MPHLTIEYSPGLEVESVFAAARAAHGVMLASHIFPTAGIRVRAHRSDIAIVADDHSDNAFMAMTLSVGAGRETAVLRAAGQAIFDAVRATFADRLAAPHFALSLDIRQIDPDLSWKETPIHARLRGHQRSDL